ncbi:hypothetical protein [Oceanisphaera sp. IT1-181]|uniref:hypothetical protein n=1 Tax=Oceanisphaera sp. IT1-181 TaxID=3081199 RepID=UPI0029C9FE53|nr:hypothetical protein [Oceanisphaera sp. IT1-181]
MKTTSVALFLALSAGYLGAANAESLSSHAAKANKEAISSNEKRLESDKTSRTAVVTKKQD